ncbi:MAG: DUF2637 domain-containing protein [Streptomycetales bacterium]
MARPDPATGIALALGGAAFAASFTHVRDVAAAHGQPGWIAWAIAVSVELMAIGSGLEIRRRRARTHRYAWPLTTLLLGVAMSLAANLQTAGPGPWGKVMAAWPAIAFLAVAGLIETRPTTRPTTSPVPARPESVSLTRDEPGTVPTRTQIVPGIVPETRTAPPRPRPVPTVPTQATGTSNGQVRGDDHAPSRDESSDPFGPSPAPELVAFAQRLAADHHNTHGRPITRDVLRSRLRVSNQLAGQLLTALRTPPHPTPERT